MGCNSSIRGEINGISKDSFELIKEDLEEAFETVFWNNNAIEIDSYGKHYEANMFPVYDKIAFCIDGDNSGGLEVVGDECLDYSIIFFCHRQWEQIWAEVTYPQNPFEKPKILERVQ